eukprot:TRINITY_DN31746_c0_g1_i8.p3 TRINITY_DN31746_c0_g1~~TRINITY_DN31746_c0_g1_i8.p3  ORF type:complete len:163 (-),score=10.96 TRINITY_DN31746_c0_g1_i8:603-1091(-)
MLLKKSFFQHNHTFTSDDNYPTRNFQLRAFANKFLTSSSEQYGKNHLQVSRPKTSSKFFLLPLSNGQGFTPFFITSIVVLLPLNSQQCMNINPAKLIVNAKSKTNPKSVNNSTGFFIFSKKFIKGQINKIDAQKQEIHEQNKKSKKNLQFNSPTQFITQIQK